MATKAQLEKAEEDAAAEAAAAAAKAAEEAKASAVVEADKAGDATAAEEATAAKAVDRIEEYAATKPDGSVVRVRHNIDKGTTQVIE